MYWENGLAKQELTTNTSAKSILEEVGRTYCKRGTWKYWPHKHDKKAIAQLVLRLERNNKKGCCSISRLKIRNSAAAQWCVLSSDMDNTKVLDTLVSPTKTPRPLSLVKGFKEKSYQQ